MTDFILFDENETSTLTLHTPVEALFNQHALELSHLIHITNFVTDKHHILKYFKEGLATKENNSYFSTQDFFDFDSAKRALDAKYWSSVMSLTDILEVMPAERRNEWSQMISEHKIEKGNQWEKTTETIYIPSFERDIVMSTIGDMLHCREKFMAERIDGLFRNLSNEHVTNVPEGFSKRMIIGYMFSYSMINHGRSNYIHDLRCVIAKFMGRDAPTGNETYQALDNIKSSGRYGEWHTFDGGALKIRLYMKGTAHMEIHPSMSYRLNMMLAMLHPFAIPAEFRTKPTKKAKEHQLHTDILPFRVVRQLNELKFDVKSGKTKTTCYQTLSKEVIEILQMIGGNYIGGFHSECLFDYDVKSIIRDLANSGIIPDKISHQFYPTPESLAKIVVELVDIKENDLCLEPSAGMGGIADFMPKENTECVEINKLHADVLKQKGYTVYEQDFLTFNPEKKYNIICMNPPFSDGRAVAHIKHATTMLQGDGSIVCILPASNLNKQLVDGFNHSYSEVYSGLFKGTGVSVVVVKLTRL